ncbi:FKBP-type peptidyl-prolyl cis-trans isomerase [Lacibacter sediminis]|jgi:FKBP-type peptidyl-prolyl cis-trans isomerase 2|uniref:Peptidyl-prolyl cis-trans isomerase n=1 Tax=Lacibacter sediminis TaxID=2760713 RepID=A0A7G5XLP2_9BACT|nr:peptidylprolyl isomerase [Lacibacter sediminis]QNA46395.1 peptidylprolyl isomerase [Lacibacter sediminis]
MQQAKKGDTVRVHYTGKLTTGEQFDSSTGREPLEFEVGAGMMIKGFDDAVVGMAIGDKKTINIQPNEAYGERNEQMIIEFPRSNFPDDMAPEIGMQLMMNNSAGQQFPVTITEVQEEIVVLDANHMLAGKELVFDIEMVEIDAKGLIIVP